MHTLLHRWTNGPMPLTLSMWISCILELDSLDTASHPIKTHEKNSKQTFQFQPSN